MKATGKDILIQFKKRWQFLLGIDILIYSIGIAVLVYFLSFNLSLSLIALLTTLLFATLIIRPWKPSLKGVSSYIDEKFDVAEYSTSLLLMPTSKLSNLARLQQINVSKQLSDKINSIRPPTHILRSSITASLLIIIGFLIYQLNFNIYPSPQINPETTTEIINFRPIDSLGDMINKPIIESQSLTIQYPKYANVRAFKSGDMNIKALEGSRISWEIQFSSTLESVSIESLESSYTMQLNDGKYSRTTMLNNSGFYNFKFTDVKGNVYTSDLYALEAIKDRTPNIEIKGISQFTSFDYDEPKIVSFISSITDDYGIADATIIATVSKGSGESVKFREEKLSFDNQVIRGRKNLELRKRIDLDQMNLEPGDELYFYIESSDLKRPNSNRSQSETYFAVIRDTTSYEFSVDGTLGVDRMPDYFRSQRQLIIDTEKLIRERPILSKKDFNFKSNELGFDQKALRLKYGEFMGVETEEAGGGINQENLESLEQEQTQEDENEDPLSEFTHDHDGDNEHNLVEEEEEEEEEEDSKNPLQAYTHDHANAEMATLFEESLRSKLLRAMTEMWDAELYLRLYEPEKSLPYQYRALKLIQDIKNSARIYVHRIGFDPPPIKEDKRLTGKLENINNYRKTENLEKLDAYKSIRKVILRLEELIVSESSIAEGDRLLFEQARNELATLAIETPGKHLKTLQQLNQMTQFNEKTVELLINIQKGLLLAIPISKLNPIKSKDYTNELNKLLLKELEIND